jgi:hypothetical protein
MKTMVRLLVLLAALLLLTGVAFAQGICFDYAFSCTNLDSPEESAIDCGCVELCFDYGGPFGHFVGFCADGNLVTFFNQMNKEVLLYYPGVDGVEVGRLKFHGSPWLNVFNGIIYCSDTGRWEVKGHKVDECIPPPPPPPPS